MSAYKQFLASDIIVTPFEVNKSFSFTGAAALTGSNVSIDRFLGKNIQSDPFISGSNPSTGQISTQDQELIYNSVKELYYSNHISSSYGDVVNTASLVPGRDTAGDRLEGTSQSSGRYFEYPQSDLNYAKFFPTGANETIAVLSIPSRLYGDYIQPGSLIWEDGALGAPLTDDGEGNLLSGSNIVGNIIYSHGLAIITDQALTPSTFQTSSNVTCSFSSSYTIYETQYKCTIRENEFNFSLNPSLIENNTTGSALGFVTESYFSPYVTTVGLYDNDQNLLAVGKLSQPLPTSPTTDTTILINIDR